MLGDYMSASNFGASTVRCDWTLLPIPEGCAPVEIPAFMVQPLVENALWHGLGGTAVHGSWGVAIDIPSRDKLTGPSSGPEFSQMMSIGPELPTSPSALPDAAGML